MFPAVRLPLETVQELIGGLIPLYDAQCGNVKVRKVSSEEQGYKAIMHSLCV